MNAARSVWVRCVAARTQSPRTVTLDTYGPLTANIGRRMRRGRILVADDSATLRAEVAAALEGSEVGEVLEAGDGLVALRMMVEHRPDLVICDLVMPVCDGIQLLRMRAATPELANIPVVMLTAASQLERRVELLERGAADYIVKPFDRRELLARVRVHLRSRLLQEELEEANRLLQVLSCTDGLTGIYNRRHFDIELDAQLSRSRRYKFPLSLLLVDVDHFKRVNDEHGHPAGDAVLRAIAGSLQSMVRKADVVARYGGEEIALVLANTGEEGAAVLAERVRAAVAGLEIVVAGATIRCTVSVGVATSHAGDPLDTSSLLHRADVALYTAKRTGRDRVVAWAPALEPLR